MRFWNQRVRQEKSEEACPHAALARRIPWARCIQIRGTQKHPQILGQDEKTVGYSCNNLSVTEFQAAVATQSQVGIVGDDNQGALLLAR